VKRFCSRTAASGQVSTYTYDAAGNLVNKSLGTGEVFTYAYGTTQTNGGGRLISATDPAGSVQVQYDARGNVSERRRANSCNVAGLIEGSDPVLKNETIVFSAHFDHATRPLVGELEVVRLDEHE